MSWFGRWFGAGGGFAGGGDDEDEELTPIAAPYEPGDAAYVDHTELALARLPHYLARLV